MKNRILFLGLVAMLLTALSFNSCSPDYETEFEVKTLKVKNRDLSAIAFDVSGGSKEIPVETNLLVEQWVASSNAEWCKVDKQSGKVTISAGSSDLYRPRVAVVTIAYGHQSYEIQVRQSGEEAILLIDGEREGVVKTIAPNGGDFEVTVTSNMPLDYINIPELGVRGPWIELTSIEDISGGQILKFTSIRNMDNSTREAVVTLQSSKNHLYTSSFIVSQSSVWKPVELRLDMLSANATQDNDGGGLPALIDNNMGTYYHSLWSGPAPGQKPHYIQIEFDEPLEFIAIEYHGRGGGNAPGDVKRAGIWVSETGGDDDSEWTKAATVTYDMNTTVNTRYKMNEVVAELGGEYKYIRFIPEARRNADPLDPSGGNGWFNMSDMFVYTFDTE